MWKPQHFSTPKQQKSERKIYYFIFLSSNYQNMQHFSLLMFLLFFLILRTVKLLTNLRNHL